MGRSLFRRRQRRALHDGRAFRGLPPRAASRRAATLPVAESISGLQLPTGISLGQGGVGVGMEVDRSPGTGLALALLASAATARLRHELGVTYHVGADYQLAGPDQAHLTIAADCLDTNAEQVASTLLAVIDNLASSGPEEAELEHERERFRRAIKAPADAVEWFATGDLIGVTRESCSNR